MKVLMRTTRYLLLASVLAAGACGYDDSQDEVIGETAALSGTGGGAGFTQNAWRENPPSMPDIMGVLHQCDGQRIKVNGRRPGGRFITYEVDPANATPAWLACVRNAGPGCTLDASNGTTTNGHTYLTTDGTCGPCNLGC